MSLSSRQLASTSLVLLTLGSAVSAQLGSVVVTSDYYPKSLAVGRNNYVMCSFEEGGMQIPVDAEDPTAPIVCGIPFDPTYFDQFADSAYTTAFGGRLLTAHVNGGVNLLDVSVPCAYSILDDTNILPPKFTHEGLKFFTDTTGTTYAAHSEHNLSGTGGGLILWELTGGGSTLTFNGNYTELGWDGNALEISNDGQYVWQIGYEDDAPMQEHMVVYDTNLWTTPTIVGGPFALPNPTSYLDIDLEQSVTPNLIGALGVEGGLIAVDITDPEDPIINQVLISPIVHFDGVTFFPNSPRALAWGYIEFGGTFIDFILGLDASVPGAATPGFFMGYNMEIEDIKVEINPDTGMHVFVLGAERTGTDVRLDVW